MSGLFITFEGGEGAGKTTQIQNLASYFKQEGMPYIVTREPGGTPEAEKIRSLLVQRDGGEWTAEAETLLFFAARHMHVTKVIQPSLKNNIHVICDRFTDSTRAYQSYGHQQPLEFIEALNMLTLNNLSPDLTFIMDIDPKIGLKRSLNHNNASNSREDRFEKLDLSFHQRLREGFLDIAKNNPYRCHVIDANQSQEIIKKDITAIVKAHIENGKL